MRTIKSILEKLDEKKKELTEYDSHFEDDEVVDRRNRERGFNRALEEAKPIIKKEITELLEEIEIQKKVAKRCLEFKGCRCSNKDCKNISCPLN